MNKLYFYVDKTLLSNYLEIINEIISNNKYILKLFILKNSCINFYNNNEVIKKILVPYYYKKCIKELDVNIYEIKYLKTYDRIFYLVSYSKNKCNIYFYLNLYCDTYNLLTSKEKITSKEVITYNKMLKKLKKVQNSCGYLIKNEYDKLSQNEKNILYVLKIKKGKFPVIITF